MTDSRLPVASGGEIVEFDPRVSSPVVRRGLDRLAAIMAAPRTPVHYWSYWGYGAKSAIEPSRRPRADRVRAEDIPQELIDRFQWVCWDWAWHGNKWRKPPLSPITGAAASEMDPRTWASFDQARAFATRHGLPGIGFVLTEDDPFVIVDIDECRDPQTGNLEAWADWIVLDLHSYTEVSPSGRGLHVLVRGALTENERYLRNVRPEMYDTEQFFAVTGQHVVGTPRAIMKPQIMLSNVNRYPSDSASDPLELESISSLTHPVFMDDLILVSCWDGKVHALDVGTGSERWDFHAGGRNGPAVAASNGVAYIGNDIGELAAVAARTGEITWQFRASASIRRITPIDNVIYVRSWKENGFGPVLLDTITILDAATGAVLRRFDGVGSYMDPSPLNSHGFVFITDGGGVLHALRPGSGDEVWCAPLSIGGEFSIAERTVGNSIFGVSTDQIFSIDSRTGRMNWRRELPGFATFNPILVDPASRTLAYTRFEDEGLFVLDTETGEDRWQFDEADWLWPAVASDQSIFVTEGETSVVALDLATGWERWLFQIPTNSGSQPLVACDGLLYLGEPSCKDDWVFAVDEAQGALVWEDAGCLLKIEHGLAFVGRRHGGLSALDARTGAERWELMPPGAAGNAHASDGHFLWGGESEYWSRMYNEHDGEQGVYSGRLEALKITHDQLFIATDHALHVFQLD